MTSGTSNYGAQLGYAATSTGSWVGVGELVNLDPPELLAPWVAATNHGSNNRKEFVPSNLIEITEFKAVIAYIASDVTQMVTDAKAGTKRWYRVLFPNNASWVFQAGCSGVKPLPADAENPEELRAELTFRPTGDATIS